MHRFLKPACSWPEERDRGKASRKSHGRGEKAAIGCSFKLIHSAIPFLGVAGFHMVQTSPANTAGLLGRETPWESAWSNLLQNELPVTAPIVAFRRVHLLPSSPRFRSFRTTSSH